MRLRAPSWCFLATIALAASSASAGEAAFTLDKGSYAPGETVTLRFKSAVPSKEDDRAWICIIKAGEPDSAYGTWEYVTDGATSATLTAPEAPGDYEVRLHVSYPARSHNCVHRVSITVGDRTAEPAKPAGGDAPAAPSGPVTKVKTPEHAWKGFGVGSQVTFKMVSEFSGAKTEMTMTHELVKQGDAAYAVKTTNEMAGGFKTDATMEYEVEKPAAAGGDPKDAPKVEKGNETVKVAAGSFECEWIKTTTPQGWSKVWSSDKVPGKLVKMESEMSGGKSSMELVQFTKK